MVAALLGTHVRTPERSRRWDSELCFGFGSLVFWDLALGFQDVPLYCYNDDDEDKNEDDDHYDCSNYKHSKSSYNKHNDNGNELPRLPAVMLPTTCARIMLIMAGSIVTTTHHAESPLHKTNMKHGFHWVSLQY